MTWKFGGCGCGGGGGGGGGAMLLLGLYRRRHDKIALVVYMMAWKFGVILTAGRSGLSFPDYKQIYLSGGGICLPESKRNDAKPN